MENEVVTNVVEATEVAPEVVEAVETAIEPIPVPTIEIPANDEKKILGMDQRTLVDTGIALGLVGAGAALDRIIPWAVRKIKQTVNTAKNVLNAAKNDATETGEQPATQEVPQTEATPAPQESK